MPKSYAVAFFIALVASLASMPLARKLGFQLGALSRPGGRNVNAQPIARLGGLGIFLALWAAVASLFFVESSVSQALYADSKRILGLFVGSVMMVVLGAVDDTRPLRARTKLLVQLTGAAVAYAAGFRLDVVALPWIGNVELGWLAAPMTLLWIAGICNAINLIDGLDGLAAGIVFCAATTNFVVAYLSDAVVVGLIMVATIGAVLGFLYFNFNPARIFMGDSGSYALGFILAASALAAPFQKASTAVSLLVPIVALGVPIVDTLFAMFRRILERRSIFSPDRGHIHHRLLDMGITHRRAVLLIYGASIMLAAAAIAISLGRDWQVGLALTLAAIVMAGLVRSAGLFHSAMSQGDRAAPGGHDEQGKKT